MEQMPRRSGAVMKDVQIILSTEGCVEGTGQVSNIAAVKGVHTELCERKNVWSSSNWKKDGKSIRIVVEAVGR